MSQTMTTPRWRSSDRLAEVERALERLESSALHPETLPIHDELYLLKSAMQAEELREAHAHLRELSALLQASLHPDRASLAALVTRFKGTEVEAAVPHAPDVEETLAEMGIPVIDGDLPTALRRFAGRQEELRRALQDRMSFLEAQYVSTARAANLLGVVAAVLAGLWLTTGAVALDLIEIDWIDPAETADLAPNPLEEALLGAE